VTTGSIDKNHYSFIPTFLGGSQIGWRFRKTWTGVDRPSVPAGYDFVSRYNNIALPLGSIVIRERRGYTKPLKRSTVVENPFSCNYFKHNDIKFTQKNADGFVRDFSTAEYVGSSSITFAPGQGWNANDDIKIFGKLREKIAGSDWNAGVATAESIKTLSLITNSATRIFTALKHVKGGRLASAAAVLTDGTSRAGFFKKPTRAPTNDKQMSSLWLELQYGWKPLLKDVKDAAEFLAHLHSVPNQQIYRVRKKREISFSTLGTWENRQGEVSCSIKCIVREKSVPLLSGILDPYSVAWELLPWSFVVDWFIPVGNYLQARSLSEALEATYVKTTYLKIKLSGSVSFNGYYHPEVVGGISRDYGEIVRTVTNDLVVPLPKFKGIKKAASLLHCINAIALLSSIRASVGSRDTTNILKNI
jgi:hypothetical protein